MAKFIIGDYRYTTLYNNNVSAVVVDTTKATYQDIPSQVTYNNVTYNIVNIKNCFRGCTSLTTAPEIPSSVTNMQYCFSNCTSLTSAPTIPSSVTDMASCFQNCTSLTTAPEIPSSVMSMGFCFYNCTSLTTAPEIPSSVTDMQYCFHSCYQLTNAPRIPSNVTNMTFCFYGCRSLIEAPEIPESVNRIDYCFTYCKSLQGNIYVNNSNITDYRGIFTDINNTNDIYIINNTNPTDESVSTKWREIIAYTNNPKIHFEADDHTTPRATLQVTRTDSSGKSAQDGTHVHIIVNYEIFQDNIPIGWTVPRLIFERLAHDSDEEFIPVREGQDRGVYELDEEQHIIIYTIKDGYKTTTVTAILSRVMALLDFLGTGGQDGYIDTPGMGMTVGNIAKRNGLDIQFPTTIGKELLPATQPYNPQEVSNPSGNPSENGWYEYDFIKGKYYETKDIEVDNSKIYFKADGKSVDLNNYQLIIGKYNKKNDDAVLIVGNGINDENRSNLIEIGNNGMSVMTIDSNGNSVPIAFLGYGEGRGTTSIQYAPYIDIGKRHETNSIGNYSVVEGYDTTASNVCSHAEGIDTTASGYSSHAEGIGTTASGYSSHAEGYNTKASGAYSHAEGNNTTASDGNSHAEGIDTTASGYSSHAEGIDTTASGDFSHAQNFGTIAAKSYQTAIGRYNIEDAEETEDNQKAFIIGNGTSDANRSNGFTVDWDGNVDIASGAKYKINGVALSASDVDAVPTSGGTITGDLTVEGVTYLGLDVDSSASKTTPATSGEDKDLFNTIRVLGWYDDVIV